uniref:Adenosylmethionine decarboxylase n=1 Tax=Nelumbo nucifera TaxID=4432 RepID=A0A822YNX5_NELNU|nr:TPA_asm: hypothetical protein HUJ06_004857 [Nelumbo nucifera]
MQYNVVSVVGNRYLDAYALSESSLFVYPTKMIIKACGTTQLLKSIPPLLFHACQLGLVLCRCRYTRGNFIFPKLQPFPRTNFREEVMYLEHAKVTDIEVCMTEHDHVLAYKFYRHPGDNNSSDVAGKETTELTGIGNINSHPLV